MTVPRNSRSGFRQAVAQPAARDGDHLSLAAQLSPLPTPLHLCSRRRIGTRNLAPAAATVRGLRTAGGARDKTDVRPAHVAGPRPGRSPVDRTSDRREVARGRPGLTRPERPLPAVPGHAPDEPAG